MLIRIVDHFIDNPKRIDKLISIKGLPDDWFFIRNGDGTVNLKDYNRAVTSDVDENIPYEIRNLCEPLYITFRYSPVEKGVSPVIEQRRILGIKIDYNTTGGQELWDRIERYMEESIPRDEKLPKPVVCAFDERAPFKTFMSSRNRQTNSLVFTPAPVPEVDLNRYRIKEVIQVEESIVNEIKEPIKEELQEVQNKFECEQCKRVFVYEKTFKRHVRQHAKEKVGV